jgi:hypothetical protein
MEKIDRDRMIGMAPAAEAAQSSNPVSRQSFVTSAVLSEVRAHPRFPEAMRLFAKGIVEVFRGDRLLNLLVSDRGRMVIGFLSLYLHNESAPNGRGEGFSVGEMKALVASLGIASPGRTGAVLTMMRVAGYLSGATAAEDRRKHVLVPTERLRAAHRERWVRIARAMRPVLPEAAAVFRLGDPEFEAAFVRLTSSYFIEGTRLVDAAPQLTLFVERNAGLVILFDILSTAGSDDTFPSMRPVSLSISALARRFSVSRAHVRTLLRDAEAAGLIERSGDGTRVAIRPDLVEALKNFFAFSLVFVARCALEAGGTADLSDTPLPGHA